MQRPLPHLAGSWESTWRMAWHRASVPWEGLRRGAAPAATLSPAHAKELLMLTSGLAFFFFFFFDFFFLSDKSTDSKKAKEPLAR